MSRLHSHSLWGAARDDAGDRLMRQMTPRARRVGDRAARPRLARAPPPLRLMRRLRARQLCLVGAPMRWARASPPPLLGVSVHVEGSE